MIENYKEIKKWCASREVKLVAISKTQSIEKINMLYKAGQRAFGENKVQEMIMKQCQLPPDYEWHLVGHLQTNKVKFVAPFVSLIHSVDSLKLLKEIDKHAANNRRVQAVLLQIFIANEETKFGLSEDECLLLLQSNELKKLKNISIEGLMGMATNTNNQIKVAREFRGLKKLFDTIAKKNSAENVSMKTLSMGMSSDYQIAVQEGSNLVRLGSIIFGERNKTV